MHQVTGPEIERLSLLKVVYGVVSVLVICNLCRETWSSPGSTVRSAIPITATGVRESPYIFPGFFCICCAIPKLFKVLKSSTEGPAPESSIVELVTIDSLLTHLPT